MSLMNIPIPLAAKTVEIETDDIPIDVYWGALYQGLKVLLNRKMSKISFHTDKTTRAKLAMDLALKNKNAVMEGKIAYTKRH